MERNEVLAKVTEICRDIFDDEDLELTEDSCAADLEQWDSLKHLSVISDLEDEFQISFTLDEMNNCKSIGKLTDAVISHMNQ